MTHLLPSSIVSGNSAIQTYKRHGLELTTQPVEEVIVIQSPSISQNSSKLLPLSKEGMTLRLLSLYVNPVNKIVDYTVTLKILINGIEFFAFTLVKANLPFRFPDAILMPDMDIEITCSIATEKVLIYAKEVAVTDSLSY